ncbi:hypothetical protein BOKEGFJH_00013 [Chlamydia avium]|nr:hypothetical protein BOKEGFJH_00013 [Chlamydia avium]
MKCMGWNVDTESKSAKLTCSELLIYNCDLSGEIIGDGCFLGRELLRKRISRYRSNFLLIKFYRKSFPSAF